MRLRSPSSRARSNTGVTGISYTVASVRPGGRRYRFFTVRAGSATPRRINIDTLGKDEAFRRAVQIRAAYEVALRESNAAIQSARNHQSH